MVDSATAAELWTRARLQWREAVELGLHDSEDIVYGILPLLVQGLREDPDHLPSLDLLSDMLMEIGAYEEAVEFAEKMCDLVPDDAECQRKWSVLTGEENGRRRAIRVYLHQKRVQLTKSASER